jgi:CheY-like chemotaxis protein/two-component sensor histidine kinase
MVPDAQRKRAVTSIYTNARRQGQLIDELLDISRIISGKLSLERTAVDLRKAVAAAIEGVQHAADGKGIRLVVTLDPAIGTVQADANRLQQILANLLSNAVKFTPNGGAIEVDAARPDDRTVEIRVADNGQGIPAQFLPAIFEPFRQADTSSTRRHGGLGLGLAIVKHLVEVHGGTITASSPGEGKGATFRVRLPVSPPPTGATTPHDSGTVTASTGTHPVSSPSLQGISVLVVDDDRECRDVLAAALAGHRAEVMTAASAADALEIMNLKVVDVLVSDVAMPDEDGYSLIRKIRALDRPQAAVPAVAVTSFAREEDRHRALQAGFHRHLAKPVDARSLVAVIKDLAHGA